MCPLCKLDRLTEIYFSTTKIALEMQKLEFEYADIIFDIILEKRPLENNQTRIDNRETWRNLVRELGSKLSEALTIQLG
jgi:hypothetical protein